MNFSPTQKTVLRWCVGAIAAGLVIVALTRIAAHFIPVSYIHGMQAEFEELPPNDNELQRWLDSQPGMVRERAWVKRNGNVVEVTFIQVRRLDGNPPIPDLDRKCAELGYKGKNASFYDVRDF